MKYMGSKSRIAKDIVPILQDIINKNNITTYIEPFVGGANIIDKITCEERHGSDSNKYLVSLLQRVQNKEELLDEVTRELYTDVRSNQNTDKYDDWVVGNVGFLASFNGRWFDGGYAQTGVEKTKNGSRIRNYYEESKNNIQTQALQENFTNIIFSINDYLFWDNKLSNCLIYCDPPYANVKQYQNSILFDYEKFWETMRSWSKDNIVIISEQNAPEDFKCIWEKEVSRSIKATDKTKSTEKLFVYKGEE